jgi:general secretion pathway protein H
MTARRAAGFTLLELLVVLAIIGTIVTFAALSLGSRALDEQLETEAERLFQLLSIAAEDAEVQGIDLGWRYTSQGYEFLALAQSGEWARLETGGSLRARALPQPLAIDLSVEGRALPPSSPNEELVEPQVLLLSSGEASSFRLDMRARGHKPYVRLEGDALGRLSKKRFAE